MAVGRERKEAAPEKEPESAKSAVKDHAKAHENAKSLQRAIARLLDQTARAAEDREQKIKEASKSALAQPSTGSAPSTPTPAVSQSVEAEEAKQDVEMEELHGALPLAPLPPPAPAAALDSKVPPLPPVEPPKPRDPPIYTPFTMYGYDSVAGGGLKKLIGSMASTVATVRTAVPVEQGDALLDRKQDAHDTMTEAQKLISEFEQSVRDTQNGWMRGKPIEADALKERAAEVRKQLAALEVSVRTEADRPKLKMLLQSLDDFPAQVDIEIERLQLRVQARVDSNVSAEIAQQMLETDVLYSKLTAEADIPGDCHFKSIDESQVDGFLADPLNSPPLTSPRAYILVGDPQSGYTQLFYIDRTGGNPRVQALQVTDKLVAAMQSGEDSQMPVIGGLIRGGSRLARGVLTMAGRAPLRPPTTVGSPLSPYQEGLLRDAVGHTLGEVKAATYSEADLQKEKKQSGKGQASGWEQILPCPKDGMAAEMALRKKETKECIDECKDEALGAEMARQKAIQRLLAGKEQELQYGSVGASFTIQHIKEEKSDNFFFRITYSDEDKRPLDPRAMAEAVKLCHLFDPLIPVELSCSKLDYSIERVARPCAERMQEKLEHAIQYAEECRRKGIYISIKLDSTAQDVLAYTGDPKGLRARAAKLHKDWEQHVKGEEDKAADRAERKYAPSAASALEQLLAQPRKEEKRRMEIGTDVVALKELNTAFAAKEGERDFQVKRAQELTTAVHKLETRTRAFQAESQSIRDQVGLLDKELESNEVQADAGRLAEIAEELGRLKAMQEAFIKEAKSDLSKIAGLRVDEGQVVQNEDEHGTAQNYRAWFAEKSTEMKDAGISKQQLGDLTRRVEDVYKRAGEEYRAIHATDTVLSNIQRLTTAVSVYKAKADEAAQTRPRIS